MGLKLRAHTWKQNIQRIHQHYLSQTMIIVEWGRRSKTMHDI